MLFNPIKSIKELNYIITINNKLSDFFDKTRHLSKLNELDFLLPNINIKKLYNKIIDNFTYFFTTIWTLKLEYIDIKPIHIKTYKIDEIINIYVNKFNLDEIKEVLDNYITIYDPNRDLSDSDKKMNEFLPFKEIKVLNNNVQNIGITTLDKSIEAFNLIKKDDSYELFDKKKEIFNVITDYINKIKLDETSSTNYTYCINKLINGILNKYHKQKGRNIFKVIYKGGQSMKNIFETIKDILDRDVREYMDKYFSKSDADYQLSYIGDYTEQDYIDGMKIIMYVLKSLKEILVNYDSLFFKLEDLTYIDMDKMLKDIDTLVQSKKATDNDPKFFPLINKVIGITIGNKSYFTEEIGEIKGLLTLYDKILDPNSITNKQKQDFINRRKLDNSNRNNYMVSYDQTTIGKNTRNQIIDLNTNDNPYYYYLNETLVFSRNSVNEVIHFSLGRIKYNTVIYYTDDKGNYGFLNIPGEIFDITINKEFDYKLQQSKFLNINYAEYYKNDNKENKYLSFDLRSFLIDFILQFEEARTFWTISKYNKKITRFLFFLNLMISQYTQDKYDEIKNKIIRKIQSNDYNQDFREDYINIFFKLFEDNVGRRPDMVKFNEVKNEILKIFSMFKYTPNNIKDRVELKYMMKYLKYKSKYLKLK